MVLLTNMNHHISEKVATPTAHRKRHNFIEKTLSANANFHMLTNGLVWKHIYLINNLLFCHHGGWQRESAFVKL